MKRDGFEVEHREHCEVPRWRSAQVARRGAGPVMVQQCVSCGAVWRKGDPSGPAQARTGYPVGRPRGAGRVQEVIE